MKVLFFTLLVSFSLPSFAQDEQLARLDLMVRSGVITKEAAQDETRRLQDKRHQPIAARSEAQRHLASVNPSLKPLKIIRMKAKPMILFLE